MIEDLMKKGFSTKKSTDTFCCKRLVFSGSHISKSSATKLSKKLKKIKNKFDYVARRILKVASLDLQEAVNASLIFLLDA